MHKHSLTPVFEVHMSVVSAGLVPFMSSMSVLVAETLIESTRLVTVGREGVASAESLAVTRSRFTKLGASTTLTGCWSRMTNSAIASVVFWNAVSFRLVMARRSEVWNGARDGAK